MAAALDLDAIAASLHRVHTLTRHDEIPSLTTLRPGTHGRPAAFLDLALTDETAAALKEATRRRRGTPVPSNEAGQYGVCDVGEKRVGVAVGRRGWLAEPWTGDLWLSEQAACGCRVHLADFPAGLAIAGGVVAEIFQCDGDVETWLCVWAPALECSHATPLAFGAAPLEAVARSGLHAGVVCGTDWSPVTTLAKVPSTMPVIVEVDEQIVCEVPADDLGGIVGAVARLHAAEPLAAGVRVLVAPAAVAAPVSCTFSARIRLR